MGFIKPPWFNAEPVASRGLAVSGNSPNIREPVIVNVFQDANYRPGYGWFDYVVPAGYVPGDGLTVTIDVRFTGPANSSRFLMYGVAVDGGALTNAPVGLPAVDNSAWEIGTVYTPFCALSADAEFFTPTTRSLLSFSINGVNRNDAGWVGEPGDEPLVGGGTIANSNLAPPGLLLPPNVGYTVFTLPGGAIWFNVAWELGDLKIGGNGFSAGPAPGSITYGPGDHISIVFIGSAGVFAQGTIIIRQIEVDAGAGGISNVPLASVKVAQLSTIPYFTPRAISGVAEAAVSSQWQWVLDSVSKQTPYNFDPPIINGTPVVGQTLTLDSQGVWGSGPFTFTRQWLADGLDIPGKIGFTLPLITAYLGNDITCKVTAKNNVGSVYAISNVLGPVTGSATADRRVTMDGNPRITEAGNTRITE